ncbi:MAG TPA: DDE-type integrase/transposase/recombinase [Candidatus Acidoferrales bacterium]|nr:DDE-type integrase/transposase/recombinase [Candidatus Acidoferrales bacterium]
MLRRAGLSRRREREPQAPVVRYERQAPGERVHIDTQKLGRMGEPGHRVTGHRTHRSRGIGWEFAHVAIDDYSRTSLVTMVEDEGQDSAVAFLEQVVAHYRACGIRVQRVMTDNGSACQSKAFDALCEALGIEHRLTRPKSPQTNGMVERFNGRLEQVLRSHHFNSAQDLATTLHRYVWLYNEHLPQKALEHLTPLQARKRWRRSHPHLFSKPD